MRRDGCEVLVEGVRAGGGRRGGGRGVVRWVVGTGGDGEGASGGGGEAREEGGGLWGHRRSEEKPQSSKWNGSMQKLWQLWIILHLQINYTCKFPCTRKQMYFFLP